MSALGIVALVLVAWIALTALAAWAAGRRNPPLGEFVTVDGVRLHYLARGPKDARPLVILHGNGAMIQDFLIAGVIDRAAERFRVIGDSIVEPDQAPRLEAMLPRALLRTEHGVGHMIHHASPDRIVEAVKLVEAWV